MSKKLGNVMFGWTVAVALLALAGLGLPDAAAAESRQHEEQSGGAHATADGHASEHHHKNHVALFVGATEAEEHEGHKEDPRFTLGLDYERRLSGLFGLGAMFDWVVEGGREILIGPIGFCHAYKGLVLSAAPCYQSAREGGHEGFVFRAGAAWEFEVHQYSISPHLIYDFAEEQNFLVIGVGLGRGF